MAHIRRSYWCTKFRQKLQKGGDGIWSWRRWKIEFPSSKMLRSGVPHILTWNPGVGKVAIAVREGSNPHDRYAVAILEEDTCCTVGH